MTIQTIFDRMMLMDNQLDLIAGGDDVSRGLTAVNMVQDWWEAIAAQYPRFLRSKSTFATAAQTETTAWPSNLMRLDSLWRLDANGRPVQEITPIEEDGGHIVSGSEWMGVAVSTGYGPPTEYDADGPGGEFFWSPTPDAIYTLRGYGLWAEADYTAAANTFGYPDPVALPIAGLAVQILKTGLDRDLNGIQAQADIMFRPVVRSLRRAKRMAEGRAFSEYHDT